MTLCSKSNLMRLVPSHFGPSVPSKKDPFIREPSRRAQWVVPRVNSWSSTVFTTTGPARVVRVSSRTTQTTWDGACAVLEQSEFLRPCVHEHPKSLIAEPEWDGRIRET